MDEQTGHEEFIRQIVAAGVTDPLVLAAIRQVPRHLFVPEILRAKAYDDSPLPIGHGQTISQPLMVALMTQLLRLKETDRVLEIGTGSGYQTAILSLLAKEVVTIERLYGLAESARTRLNQLGYTNIQVVVGDGSLGWPVSAPYDAIIVTAGAPEVPKNLLQQMALGGKLAAPIGSRTHQTLVLVEKTKTGETIWHSHGACAFVPLIGEQGWQV